MLKLIIFVKGVFACEQTEYHTHWQPRIGGRNIGKHPKRCKSDIKVIDGMK